ncbi:SIT4-associating protein ser/thr phosphatase [Scheffersomyces xylosifermentans]|uniref:SIT4-associating protein ser/thr phosphatase n=1 Tax=Scheffersomyces xylosifermentans TaxID=1304137 RepID=UPI00315C6031
MSGSFWKFSNGFTSLSNISTLLENHTINSESGDASYTSSFDVLLKLLDESDLLQELLSNNPMLLEFLREDDVLGMLVELVTTEGVIKPQETKESAREDAKVLTTPKSILDEAFDKEKASSEKDTEDKKSIKEEDEEDEEVDADITNEEEDERETEEDRATRRATIAAEILSADVWSLTDTVMESTTNLNRLWAILDSTKPLSINLSTYFMKIMEHLLDMKCDEMITYLVENQPYLVDKFMNHLSNPPLMDFLLKLISTDKPDNSTGIIDFLQQQGLISSLISALNISPEETAEEAPEEVTVGSIATEQDDPLVRQSSAADFLKALITISANSTTDNSTIGPNELTRELVSHKQMSHLCSIMLKGGYALANGVGIIIEIIRKNNSDYDILPVLYITLESHPPTGRDPIYLGHLLHVFGSKIADFNRLLVQNDAFNKLRTPFGEIEPLGFERFKICELVAELLHCSNMALLNDNKGFDVVKERDAMREKMKEYDPISFKYNEIIVLPEEKKGDDEENAEGESESASSNSKKTNSKTSSANDTDFANDTIDSFNSKSINNTTEGAEDEEPHANANLTEEQIRASPVVGDFLKIALFDTQIISNILSMFFRFPWNNFLHNVVFDIVQQVLNGSMDIGFNKFLAIDLFHAGDITSKIIEGQTLCTDYEHSHNGLRLGFMGHLTLIAEEVVKFIQLYPTTTLSELIDVKVEDEVWEEYVSNVLYDTREKYNAILGGGEEDEDDDDDVNNTFDEGLGEIIEEVKTGLVFNPSQRNERALESDESESDDDDHFTNYMSQQLTNPASTEIVSSVESSSTPIAVKDKITLDLGADYEHGDDYIDPNDDGMSYKKSNPLYDATGSLLKSSSSSDNDDIDLDDDDDDDLSTKKNNGTKLTRAASKGS